MSTYEKAEATDYISFCAGGASASYERECKERRLCVFFSFVIQPHCCRRLRFVSVGDKRGSGPRVGVASQLGQGDTDTFLSGGLLYRIRAVITPLKITLDETRRGGGGEGRRGMDTCATLP